MKGISRILTGIVLLATTVTLHAGELREQCSRTDMREIHRTRDMIFNASIKSMDEVVRRLSNDLLNSLTYECKNAIQYIRLRDIRERANDRRGKSVYSYPELDCLVCEHKDLAPEQRPPGIETDSTGPRDRM